MRLYTATQIKAWDAYTIAHEPIASIDLMERAAQACVQWLVAQFPEQAVFKIFCGKGNNGGDGLAIARLLYQRGIATEVYILEFGHLGSEDFQTNLQRLHQYAIPLHYIQQPSLFPQINATDIVIDALFGTGLNRPLEGLAAALVNHINGQAQTIISIDVPSGMQLHASSVGTAVIAANHTLSFEATKAAFLLPENEGHTGEVVVLPIGLHSAYAADAPFEYLQKAFIQTLLRPRSRFGHKGSYGHALIIGGSWGKIGAVLLATKAAMRTGAGLTTAYIPRCGYGVLQGAAPEAMTITDGSETLLTSLHMNAQKFDAIGIGPGMGTAPQTVAAFENFLRAAHNPLVIDADGLNCLAKHPELLTVLPKRSILTPHPKEFERLFGPSANDFERVEKAVQKAAELDLMIVLKGHHTLIAAPEGPSYFNSTGNAGMATGGAGDVLTGIITSLLAQGYQPLHAALIGVYLHGLAGDEAAQSLSEEALIAGDILEHLGVAFSKLKPR